MKKFLFGNLLIIGIFSVVITGVFIYGFYISDNDYYDKEMNPYIYAYNEKPVKGVFEKFENTITHAEGYEIMSIVIEQSEYDSPDQFIWDMNKRINEVKGDADLNDLTGGIIVYSNYFLQNKLHLSINGDEFKELRSAAISVYETIGQTDSKNQFANLKRTLNNIQSKSFYFGS